MPIIESILDTDLYKLTMQKAVLAYRQDVPVEYVFNNRRPEGKFNDAFFTAFQEELERMKYVALQSSEALWLEQNVPFLGHQYVEYLRNYRFDPKEVDAKIVNGDLALRIKGTWDRTILWEVPLMAMISELYFTHCDTDWTYDEEAQRQRLVEKGNMLGDTNFADFGTRRRRNYRIQDLVVNTLKDRVNFNGTSNVHLAHKHGLKAIGTMAHEWIMGISALESLRHANRYALRIWSDVFDGNLGIALPDTFGTEAFIEDFDGYLARLFDGVRHDSGDPFKFGEKIVAMYRKLKIHPSTKTIVFSDSLDPELAMRIRRHFDGVIRVAFGIGTNFTNDFPNSPALNMVIKLAMCGGLPVVKLSDTLSKAIGDAEALRIARWYFFRESLDAN